MTLLRGMLGGAILTKTMTLPHTSQEKAEASTLMSNDLELILQTATKFHDTLFCIMEVALGTYLLSILVGRSSFLVLVPTLGKSLFYLEVETMQISKDECLLN